MKLHGLFIRGIYRSVLDEILCTHRTQPDFTLYLQPFDGDPIRMLKDAPPTTKNPIRLYASTSEDPGIVSFTADIVGWEDKTTLSPSKKHRIESTIREYQPREEGLYDQSNAPGKPSLNLVLVQRLIELPSPFCVTNLIKISDGKPYSPKKTSPGGWSRVRLV